MVIGCTPYSPCHRFNFTALGWRDDTSALPLSYKFVQYSRGYDVDAVTLSDFSASNTLLNVLLPLPRAGNSTVVTVVVRNVLGSETVWLDGVSVTITAPSVQSLVLQFASFGATVSPTPWPSSGGTNSSGSQRNVTAPDTATASSAAMVAVLMGAQAAISASLSASRDDAGGGDGGDGSSSGANAVLDGAMLAVMVLQVTACASVQCGPGVCSVGNDGPVCDCSGTGYTGSYCSVSVVATAPGSSPSSTPSASASPMPQSSIGGMQSLAAVVAQKSCASSSVEECSGHGTCIRSQSDCAVTSVQCVAVCRCATRNLCLCQCRKHQGVNISVVYLLIVRVAIAWGGQL